MIVMDGKEFLSAQEACQMLGVKSATLYAYVSRGLLTSYRQGIKRARLYLRSEVEELTRVRFPMASALTAQRGPGRSDEPPRAAAGDEPWIPYV